MNAKFQRIITTSSSCDYGSTHTLYLINDTGIITSIRVAGDTGLQPTSLTLEVGDNILDFIKEYFCPFSGKQNNYIWDEEFSAVYSKPYITSDTDCVCLDGLVVLNRQNHFEFIAPSGLDGEFTPSDGVINTNPRSRNLRAAKRK